MRVTAQELVRRRQLGAHARRLAASLLRAALRGRQARARLLRPLVRFCARSARLLDLALQLLERLELALARALQLRDLALDLLLAAALDLSQLSYKRLDALRARRRGAILRVLAARLAENRQLALDALDPPRERLRARARLLAAQPEPLVRRACLVYAL